VAKYRLVGQKQDRLLLLVGAELAPSAHQIAFTALAYSALLPDGSAGSTEGKQGGFKLGSGVKNGGAKEECIWKSGSSAFLPVIEKSAGLLGNRGEVVGVAGADRRCRACRAAWS